MDSRWYVVNSKSNKEIFTSEELEKQGFRTFVPLYAVFRPVRGKTVRVHKPLFPGYLFVKLNMETDRWRSVCGTRGVVSLVTASESGATPLPRGFVEELIETTDAAGLLPVKEVEEIVKEYLPGEPLQVVSGVFQGLSGTYEGKRGDSVLLFLSLLSGKTRVWLPASLTAPLSS